MRKLQVCPTLVIILTIVFGLNAVVSAQDGAMPTLRGDDAVRELKQTGGYDSLIDAVKAAGVDDEQIVPDGFIQSTKLTASDGGPSDQFGGSIAVNGDTAVVGAYTDDVGANADQGSAYVFVRSGTTWTQQAQLTASDGTASDRFGVSVAINGDTIVVGAYSDDVGANANQGSAYVFVRSGTTWTQAAKLTASDGAGNDQFGIGIALSGDTAVVGANMDDISAGNEGSAYVFVGSGSTWTQQAKLLASDAAANDQLGASVSIDGDTAVIGSYLDDVGANTDQGSAYVFVRSGTSWTQQGKLTASDGAASDDFGSVAISGDTAVVGAYLDDIGANANQGSVYVFVRSGTTWTQAAKLTATDGAANDWFGYSVAVSGDTVVIGAYIDDIGANGDQGSAYIFARSGTAWTQATKLTESDGAAFDWFGYSVAVSGGTVFVGAAVDDVGANTNQGSASVFSRLGNSWIQESKNVASDGAAGDYLGSSVAISGDTAVVGAKLDDVGANLNQGSAYVFVRSGTGWSEQAKLTATDGVESDRFGVSVAISGDTATIGASGDDVGANTEQGSAYVFVRSGTTWVQQAKLTASDGGNFHLFGDSVAAEGNTVIVGAYNLGAAYAFVRSGTTWTQQAKLLASDGAVQDRFGFSVAINGDTAVIGAYQDDVGANTDQGSAYVFIRSGTTWTQQAKLTASDGAALAEFGVSVAVNGDTTLISAQSPTDTGNMHLGAAYVFVRSGTTWSQQAKLTVPDDSVLDGFGTSVAVNGDTAVIGSRHANYQTVNHGAAYLFVRSGTTWTQTGKLTASDGVAGAQFGVGVGISGDKMVVGAPVGGNNGLGSAYIFMNLPAASEVSVSGRVRTPAGRGITNAFVTISGPNNFFASTTTDKRGSFVFNNVPNWRTYVLTANQRRFIFSAKVISIIDNFTTVDFIAGQ